MDHSKEEPQPNLRYDLEKMWEEVNKKNSPKRTKVFYDCIADCGPIRVEFEVDEEPEK